MSSEKTWTFLVRPVERIGETFVRPLWLLGGITTMLVKTVRLSFRPPYNLRGIVKQMLEIGVNSLPVVLITATFTGGVLALQSYTGFRRFSAESLVGTVVAMSMTRELGPVLTGLIVAGRAGAAMAAELGTMRVTEQIDALETLATNPVKHLVVPRFLGSLLMLPALTVFSDAVGIMGGFFVSTKLLGANPTTYLTRTWDYLKVMDIYHGILKAFFFGAAIALISSYQGFNSKGGAEGVGKATTRAVVLSSMTILVSDYFLSAWMFK